jgi:glycoprotein 3-alpha-L-fucosyltransferase
MIFNIGYDIIKLTKKFQITSKSSSYFTLTNSQRALVQISNKLNLEKIYNDPFQDKLYNRYKSIQLSYSNKNHRIKDNDEEVRQAKSFYLIAEYTKFYRKEKFCNRRLNYQSMNFETSALKQALSRNNQTGMMYRLLDNCLYKNCFFTCDRDRFKEADALLFHETDLTQTLKEMINNGDTADVAKEKIFDFEHNPSQLLILWNDEPRPLPDYYNDIEFNWTISFHGSSEASYCAYGCYKKLDARIPEPHFKQFVKEEFKKRKNQCLWFVSNCGAKFRINYAIQFADYFPLLVHGKCNEMLKKVNSKQMKFNDEKCNRNGKCEDQSLLFNKFYLSFENHNCSDYITEKFWRSLSKNLIPIVVVPNKEYYEKIAPPNSFIHMSDFNYDFKKLSQHLTSISTNLGLYEKYMEWKRDYMALFTSKDLEPIRFCELCYRLNNDFSSSHYHQIGDWFNQQCL